MGHRALHGARNEPNAVGKARHTRGAMWEKKDRLIDRHERQRAEDTAAPSSCPRRTNLDRFPNVRPGFGNHRGRSPGNPTTTQRSGRGWERTSKGAQRGMPTPGRPECSGLCEDDDPRIFGYFPSLESTSPGGETSPRGRMRGQTLKFPAEPIRRTIHTKKKRSDGHGGTVRH